MKPFLCSDTTNNPENFVKNGEEFMTLKTPPHLTAKLENGTDRMQAAVEKSKLHIVLRVIHGLTTFCSAVFATGVVAAIFRGTLFLGIRRAPWLYIVGLVCIVIWFVLTLLSGYKSDKVLKSEESQKAKNDALKAFDDILAYLGVPLDSTEIDVIFCKYKSRGEQIEVVNAPLQMTNFINMSFRIFKDYDNLYLANPNGKYAFSLSSMRRIRTVFAEAVIPDWHKEQAFDSDEYKVYSISKDKSDLLHTSPYYMLELEDNGEIFGIFFPCYEIKTLESVTGLKAWEWTH